MKFVVDAQLPEPVARRLQASGHEAIHTKDLPDGNCTQDSTTNELSTAPVCCRNEGRGFR